MADVEQTQSEVTEVTVSTESVHYRPHIPKFVKNKTFIFVISLVLFVLSFLVLCLIDTENSWRPSQLNFLLDFLKSCGVQTYNVTMTTWFIFFLMFGLFFVLYFALLFHKKMLSHKQEYLYVNLGRDITPREKRRFNFIFWGILVVLFALGVIAVCITFNKMNWWDVIGRQLSTGVDQFLNFLLSLGILLALILVIPLAFFILWLIFQFLIFVISLIAGGVSNSIMKSENYQKNVAISHAAASDIERSLREARGIAEDAIERARLAAAGKLGAGAGGAGGNGGRPTADVLFPGCTKIDEKWAALESENTVEATDEVVVTENIDENFTASAGVTDNSLPVDIKPVEEKPVNENVYTNNANARGPFTYESFRSFALEFQSYLAHQHFYFKLSTLRSFIAGMSAARLIILEGLSGTGKSTLPRVFAEYIQGIANFFPVQATWRDRSDITGYYSEFSGEYKETELLKDLYESRYTPNTVNLMVLDEMNISRVEYYFADFLSIFEYPSSDWLVPLMEIKEGTIVPKYIENGYIRIPENTWFVGTINVDDSTFTISDKVYDRAIVIDFTQLNVPLESNYRYDPHPITLEELTKMFDECKARRENNLSPSERKRFLSLCAFVSETFDVQVGNRVMNQVDAFVPVYVGLGGTKNEALDLMFARKILRKLDDKYENYVKDGLVRLTRYINTTYGRHVLVETETLIEKLKRKIF